MSWLSALVGWESLIIVSSKFVATKTGVFVFFDKLIIYSWAKGILSIGTSLDKSPRSIKTAFEYCDIFLKFLIAFKVSIFEIK